MESLASRRFFKELMDLLGSTVIVQTLDKRKFIGELTGYDPKTLSLCLSNVKTDSGETVHKVFISGQNVSEIMKTEKPIDLRSLARAIEKVFPNMVKLYEDARIIKVMDKITVTERGVEGRGPAADTVKKIFDDFIKEEKG